MEMIASENSTECEVELRNSKPDGWLLMVLGGQRNPLVLIRWGQLVAILLATLALPLASQAEPPDVTPRFYDVLDLVVPIPSFTAGSYWDEFDLDSGPIRLDRPGEAEKPKAGNWPSERENLAELIDQIRRIDPNSWRPSEQPYERTGELCVREGNNVAGLIIAQTAANHGRITKLINDLRSQRSLRIQFAFKYIISSGSSPALKVEDLLAWLSKNAKGQFDEETKLLTLSSSEAESLCQHIASDKQYVLQSAPTITALHGQRSYSTIRRQESAFLRRLDKNGEKALIYVPFGVGVRFNPIVDQQRNSITLEFDAWVAEGRGNGDTGDPPRVILAEKSTAFTVPDGAAALLRVEMVKQNIEGVRQIANPAGAARMQVQHNPLQTHNQPKDYVYILIQPKIVPKPQAPRQPATLQQPQAEAAQTPLSASGPKVQAILNQPLKLDLDTGLAGKKLLVVAVSIEQRPSRRILDMLAASQADVAKQGFAIVLVHAAAADEAQIKQWLKDHKLDVTQLIVAKDQADAAKLMAACGAQSLPFMLTTDDKHAVAAVDVQTDKLDQLSRLGQPAAAELKHPAGQPNAPIPQPVAPGPTTKSTTGEASSRPLGQADNELEARVAKLVALLGSKTFSDRESAEKALVEIGGPARPALLSATADPDRERATRARSILGKISVIGGTVADASGKPLAGVTIKLICSEVKPEQASEKGEARLSPTTGDSEPRSSLTDDRGGFKLESLDWERTDISVTKEGYRSSLLENVPIGTHDLIIRLGAPCSYKLLGKVQDPNGKAVPDAEVTLAERVHDIPAPAPKIWTTRTDATGRFRFDQVLDPLSPGSKRSRILMARKPDHAFWALELDSTGGQAAVRVRLGKPARITGAVNDENGKPLPGASVRLAGFLWGPGEPPFLWNLFQLESLAPQALAGNAGAFTLEGLPSDGVVGVRVTCPGYGTKLAWGIDTTTGTTKLSSGLQSLVRHPAGERLAVALTLAAVLRGSVVYETTGKPAGEMTIATQGHASSAWSQTLTDANGRFVLDEVVAEPTNVLVLLGHDRTKPPDWTTAAKVLEDLKPGRQVNDLKLVLTKGGIIQGRIMDAMGHPLKGINVAFYSAARPRAGASCQSVYSGEDGTWAFRFPPGQVYIYVDGRNPNLPGAWKTGTKTVQLKAGETLDCDFELANVLPADSPYRAPLSIPPPPSVGPGEMKLNQPLKLDLDAALAGKKLLVVAASIEQRPSRRLLDVLAAQADAVAKQGFAIVLVHPAVTDEAQVAQWLKDHKLDAAQVILAKDEADVAKLTVACGAESLPAMLTTDEKHAVRVLDIQPDKLDQLRVFGQAPASTAAGGAK